MLTAAIALAAPRTGKWSGGVTEKVGGKYYKVRYGYAPNDHASRVKFKVSNHGHKLKNFEVTVSTSGPPAATLTVSKVKIKRNGKFKGKQKEQIDGLSPEGSMSTVKISGKLKGSKGKGKFSVSNGKNVINSYAFKAKRR
jgi:hypothetical protein